MNFKENNIIKETITIIILVILALFVSIRIFPMAIFLLPIPFIVLGTNFGIKYNIIGLLIVSIVVGYILDISSAILVIILFLPLTTNIVYMIRKNEKPGKILLTTTINLFISILIIIMIVTIVLDINFIEESGKVVETVLQDQLNVLENAGIKGKELENLELIYDNIYRSITITMPSIFIVFSLIVSYLNYLLSTIILRKENYELKYKPVFSEFKLPKSIFLGAIMMFGVSYLLSKMNISKAGALYGNIVVIINFLFTLQGLSVVDFKLKEKGLKGLLRIIVLIFIFLLSTIFGRIFSILGMMDSVFDFRKPRPKSSDF